MLSRGKIRAGHARYYTEQVAAGIEDYLAGRREAPGVWDGAGARAEGLGGVVSAEQIGLLFEGVDARHPLTGEVLGRPYKVGEGVDKVMGWDLTLSAPKSFSVLWAVGGPNLAKVLDQAHAAAVAETVAYLEENAAFSRTGKAGTAQVDTNGLLIARFEHRTSRAMDPERHSHLLVSNRVRCVDGVWRAIGSKALHQQLKPAGTIYQAALRAEATSRLGVAWGAVNEHGQADLVGVPDGLVDLWSKRRRAVERVATALIADTEASLGRSLTDGERRELYQRATLDTRPKKGQETLPESIHDLWRDEAEEAGFAVEDWIGQVLHPAVEVAVPLDPEMVVEAALADLELTRSTWGRTDDVQQIAARLPARLAANATEARAWVEYLADRLVNHADVVAVTRLTDPAEPAVLRRDGRSVFEPHSAIRYTTRFTLELEQRVLDVAVSGRDSARGVAEQRQVEAEIGAHGLSADQADAVRRLCLAGDTLACLVGPAGTGKTRTIGAAVDAWSDAGCPVRGLAVSAVAADALAQEALVETDTVAKLLYEHDRPDGPREE
jgi:conjugative relaxase-like TrwC/TraI family protein